MLKVLCLFFFSFLSAFVAFAEDHALTNIRGTQIELKSYDHAIAGAVKDFVIFGNKDDATGTSELQIKNYGQVIKTVFGQTGYGLGGTIESVRNGTKVETTLFLKNVDMTRQTITLVANNREIEVKISSEGFSQGHFKNPTYSTVIDSKEVTFSMEKGEACYGFSAHLLMMILGAYLH